MRFHGVHGANVSVEAQGRRAVRTASFCDAIAFSLKPLPVNSRVSVLLGTSDEWSGALRLGVTSRDPLSLKGSLPRYACPDLIAKQGFWARPLPEKWSTDGTRLTFYVSSQGHFQLFVNNEHKGALLSGLPVKEHLWLIFDLYGITLSIQFIANSNLTKCGPVVSPLPLFPAKLAAGNAPVEVLARGPEALAAYQRACADGCLALHRTRLALVGVEGPAKQRLRRILLGLSASEEEALPRQPVTSTWVCHSRPDEGPGTWSSLPPSPVEGQATSVGDDEPYDSDDLEDEDCVLEEEYYQAIAKNIVREIMLQKRKKANSAKRTSGSLVRDALRFPSTLARRKGLHPTPASKERTVTPNDPNNRQTTQSSGRDTDSFNEDLPQDLPSQVQDLVESMLAEAESKQDWDKLESEKTGQKRPKLTMHIWDFDAHPKYFLIHQAFFSPKTIYVFVVDLNANLEDPLILPEQNWKGAELPEGSELTTSDLFGSWLSAIHASVAQSNSNVDTEESCEETSETSKTPALRPYVLLAGVQTGDQIQAEETLCRLRSQFSDSPANGHVLTVMVHPEGEGDSGSDLRSKLEELSMQLPHVSMQVPLKWLTFERALDRLTERGICLADLVQLAEVGRQCGIEDEESFFSLLAFFHHLGKVLYFESQSSAVYGGGSKWEAAVVLDPQWFIEQAYRVFALQDSASAERKGPMELGLEGVLSGSVLEQWLGKEGRDERTVLLGILESLDLLCEIEPSEMFEATGCAVDEDQAFLVPWSIGSEAEDVEPDPPCSLTMTVNFQGLLPAGLFTRLVCRVVRWSERHRWAREPRVFRRRCRVAVDRDYDVIMRLSPAKLTRLEVTIVRAEGAPVSTTPCSDSVKDCVCPAQHVCAKVRLLLEQELEAIRDLWFSRVSFQLSVTCPCDRECKEHATPKCPLSSCIHFLPLSQCLASKVVMCDFRRVKTEFIRKYFPETSVCGIRSMGKRDSVFSSQERAKDNLLAPPATPHEGLGAGIWDFLSSSTWGNNHVQVTKEDCGPPWLKSAAKMLTTGGSGREWTALARRLGYGEREVTRFEEALYPSSALLLHWMDVNAGTRYCLDLLLFCLDQMGRDDIAEAIRNQMEPEEPAPPIFLSYQWDSQAAVLGLRRRLEMCGFPCWMDVGQMGAGDALYGKIYEGISRAKVVLLCLTPRYVVSPTSIREASLADVLRKPLLPVMLDPVPWPPPGPLAVVLSPLVYVALCGIGGHGGNGRHADRESRFQEILNRVSQYAMPIPGFPGPMSPLSRGALAAPTPSMEVIEEDFRRVDTPRIMETVGHANAHQDPGLDGAGFEGDDLSNYSGTSSRGARESPLIWRRARDHRQENRVTRCTVCAIL